MGNLTKSNHVKILCRLDLDSTMREKILKNLSAIAFSHEGQYLWLGTDEFTAIERFTRLKNGKFGDHIRIPFHEFIEDFRETAGEVDVEGLDYDNGDLWIMGSHSSKRKKVDIKKDKFQIEGNELKAIEREGNRYLLARVPVDRNGNLDTKSSRSAWLKRDGCNDALTEALAEDEYLDLSQIIKGGDHNTLPGKEFFFYLPGKENGVDLEGLAVRGNRVWLGLRGPVLRGIAIVLELEVADGESHELTLKPIGPNGRLYKRHFLDLAGLGIRELCWEADCDSLLVLAGPTMDLDGSHALFRLHEPLTLIDNSLSSQKNKQLEFLGEIPHKRKRDRAEGLTLLNQKNSILVVYDSPADKRLLSDEQDSLIGVKADVFSLC